MLSDALWSVAAAVILVPAALPPSSFRIDKQKKMVDDAKTRGPYGRPPRFYRPCLKLVACETMIAAGLFGTSG